MLVQHGKEDNEEIVLEAIKASMGPRLAGAEHDPPEEVQPKAVKVSMGPGFAIPEYDHWPLIIGH